MDVFGAGLLRISHSGFPPRAGLFCTLTGSRNAPSRSCLLLPLTVWAAMVSAVIRQVEMLTSHWLYEGFRTETCQSMRFAPRNRQHVARTRFVGVQMRMLQPRQPGLL